MTRIYFMAYQNKSDTCSSLEVSRTYCTMAENHPQTLQNPVEFLLKSPLYNSGKSLSGLGDYYLDCHSRPFLREVTCISHGEKSYWNSGQYNVQLHKIIPLVLPQREGYTDLVHVTRCVCALWLCGTVGACVHCFTLWVIILDILSNVIILWCPLPSKTPPPITTTNETKNNSKENSNDNKETYKNQNRWW